MKAILRLFEDFFTFNAELTMRTMGRATATRGQGRLGRTIRKLENSVELSSKEGRAKLAEQNYRKKTNQPVDTDSPIQNLRDASERKKTPSGK